jgi:hypothetical protein
MRLSSCPARQANTWSIIAMYGLVVGSSMARSPPVVYSVSVAAPWPPLVGRAEPGEHIHERLTSGSPLSGLDARRVIERVGQGQLDEDVLARVPGPNRDVRVQPGGQADVH